MIPDIDPDLAAFRGGLRDLLRARDVRALCRAATATGGLDRALWATAARDLGVPGLLVPEAHGGAGHELAAAVVAVEELDGALAPGPFRSTLVAAAALARVPAPYAADALAAIADGSRVTLFVDATGAGLEVLGDTGRLALADLTVPYAGVADRLVLLLSAGGSTHLGLLDLAASGVELRPAEPFDLTRPGARLHGTVEVPVAPVGSVEAAELADLALLLATAEQVGLIRQVLDRTVSYLRDRYAFGRPVASFQGLKHQLALLHCDLERAVALLDHAVTSMAAAPAERRRALLASRAVLGPLTVRIASEGLRLRGGIGYTWEDDAHLFFRRARAVEHDVVDPYDARRELAGLLQLV